jgi:hypothetical protein
MGNLLGWRIGAMGGGSIASTAALETSIFTRLCLSVAGELPAQHGANPLAIFEIIMLVVRTQIHNRQRGSKEK